MPVTVDISCRHGVRAARLVHFRFERAVAIAKEDDHTASLRDEEGRSFQLPSRSPAATTLGDIPVM